MKNTLSLDNLSDAVTRRALSELSLTVAKSKRILVVTGAGISCSCGIPDFRSTDGLYSLVKQKYPNVVLKGRDLFDASLFRDAESTAVFFTFISELKSAVDRVEPSPTHHFIKTLDSKNRLLRSYTQNIDGLESQAGLLCTSSKEARTSGKGKAKVLRKDVRNVQLHGDIHRVRCMNCSAEYPCSQEYLEIFNTGEAPECPDCAERCAARIARSARPIKVGTLRPAISLYGESAPHETEMGSLQTSDAKRKPDLMIVMGTSLKVHGIKALVKQFAKAVHASSSTSKRKVIFVNKTPPGSEWNGLIDYHVQCETDIWCQKVLEDWKKMRPADWEIQKTLLTSNGDLSMSSPMKVVKATVAKTKNTDSKKKPRDNSENMPPSQDSVYRLGSALEDVSMASPEPINRRLPPRPPATPGSPSKRRQKESHYDTLQSSPSKKRTMARIDDNEPIPLFGVQASCTDLSMEDSATGMIPLPKRTTRTTRKT